MNRLKYNFMQTAELQVLLHSTKIPMRDISQATGIDERVLYRIKNCKTHFTKISVAQKILPILQVDIGDLKTAW